jgi:hypothetical protein
MRHAPKLTDKHINLPPFSKMDVSRAAQVFSQTAYASILNFIASKELPKTAHPTALFIKNVDSLFDVCIKGLIQSINAMLQLWDILREDPSISYLCTRKVSQDCLENCFSIIRGSGGNCHTPNLAGFQHAYKHALIRSCLSNSELSNCEQDTSQLLLDVLTASPITSSGSPLVMQLDIGEASVPSSDPCSSRAIPRAGIVTYVAGYVCYKYLKNHKCAACAKLLVASCCDLPAAQTLFSRLKAYERETSECGRLCVPSPLFYKFIEQCESIFMHSFENILHMPRIQKRLVSQMLKSCNLSWFSLSGCKENVNKIVSIFVRMRILYALDFYSQKLPKNMKKCRRAGILEKL